MDIPQRLPASLDKYARISLLVFLSGLICGIFGFLFPRDTLARDVMSGVAMGGGIIVFGMGYAIAQIRWNFPAWTLALPLLPIALLAIVYAVATDSTLSHAHHLGVILSVAWWVSLVVVCIAFLVSVTGWVEWWRNGKRI